MISADAILELVRNGIWMLAMIGLALGIMVVLGGLLALAYCVRQYRKWWVICLLLGMSLSAQTLPAKILIEGRTWKVKEYVEPLVDAGEEYAGLTWCMKGTIELQVERPRQEVATTLIHEILHAITKCKGGEVDLHEHIYDISPKLRQVLADNPKVMEFINLSKFKLMDER